MGSYTTFHCDSLTVIIGQHFTPESQAMAERCRKVIEETYTCIGQWRKWGWAIGPDIRNKYGFAWPTSASMCAACPALPFILMWSTGSCARGVCWRTQQYCLCFVYFPCSSDALQAKELLPCYAMPKRDMSRQVMASDYSTDSWVLVRIPW